MNNLISLTNQCAEILDKIADAHGVSRAAKIALLAQTLAELADGIAKMAKEVKELRKFKEEHTDNDDKRNEVPSES